MKKLIILVSLILVLGINKSSAVTQIGMQTNKEAIQKDEEIELNLNLKDVASFTIEMYFDAVKLQYVRGPENTNVMENRILYTWVSENGENKQDLEAGTFVFKGLEEGMATVTASGEFYNSKGESLEISDNYINIEIKNELQNIPQDTEVSQNNISQDENLSQNDISQDEVQMPVQDDAEDDNANLAVLRLNYPGISPEFNKAIKEYYLVVDNTVENLEVVAFAENNEATVTISGNENLQMGKNTINIIVESKDKTKTENYKIYVTKTNNIELANANLETLAIREGTLVPEFNANVTNYNVEVANSVDNIQILAIPQKENAVVKINGNSVINTNMEINIGDNKLEIVVVAQDGITIKKYEVNVHRRNEVEEIQDKQEQEIQAEELFRILQENEIGSGNIENILQQENNVWIVVFIAIGILIIAIYFVIKKKRKNKEKF